MPSHNFCPVSAYNRAERKIYYLSKELSGGKIFFKGSTSQLLSMDLSFLVGVVLPAETFVSHLHNEETFDEELEKRNFGAAGKWRFTERSSLPSMFLKV